MHCNQPPQFIQSSMVHSLIKAIGLFDYMQIQEPKKASLDLLECFHSREYLNLLTEYSKLASSQLEEFGLVDDAALFSGIEPYVRFLAGTILSALQALEDGFRYVINWDGGRHHAQSTFASGYCYINDAVVLILALQDHYDRILYIDLDLHHGDGVERAFYYSNRVFTLSLHKFKPGFFPGTGDAASTGNGKGAGFCRNIPITHKISGKQYSALFESSFSSVMSVFDADIIVCVCGADSLATDPHQELDIGSLGYDNCIQTILRTDIPAVFLGGGKQWLGGQPSSAMTGGYNHADTAKCWAKLTHSIVSHSLGNLKLPAFPSTVPEHEFWPEYAHNDEMQVKERASESSLYC